MFTPHRGFRTLINHRPPEIGQDLGAIVVVTNSVLPVAMEKESQLKSQ